MFISKAKSLRVTVTYEYISFECDLKIRQNKILIPSTTYQYLVGTAN